MIVKSRFDIGILKDALKGEEPDFLEPMSEEELARWESSLMNCEPPWVSEKSDPRPGTDPRAHIRETWRGIIQTARPTSNAMWRDTLGELVRHHEAYSHGRDRRGLGRRRRSGYLALTRQRVKRLNMDAFLEFLLERRQNFAARPSYWVMRRSGR